MSDTPRLNKLLDENSEAGMLPIDRYSAVIAFAAGIERELTAEKERHAQLQARCFDGGGSQNVFDAVAEARDNLAMEKAAFDVVRQDRDELEAMWIAERERRELTERALKECRTHALNEARTMAGRLNDIANVCDAALGDTNG